MVYSFNQRGLSSNYRFYIRPIILIGVNFFSIVDNMIKYNQPISIITPVRIMSHKKS